MAKVELSADKLLKKRIDKVNALRKELQNEEKSTSKEIIELLKNLMQTNPLLEEIRWNQYTPHFNDGDVCEFGVSELYYKFAESVQPRKQDDEDDYNRGFLDDYDVEKLLKEKKDILNYKDIDSLEKTIKAVNKAFSYLQSVEGGLEEMFGDGVEITVSRTGIETEDYDHD